MLNLYICDDIDKLFFIVWHVLNDYSEYILSKLLFGVCLSHGFNACFGGWKVIANISFHVWQWFYVTISFDIRSSLLDEPKRPSWFLIGYLLYSIWDIVIHWLINFLLWHFCRCLHVCLRLTLSVDRQLHLFWIAYVCHLKIAYNSLSKHVLMVVTWYTKQTDLSGL